MQVEENLLFAFVDLTYGLLILTAVARAAAEAVTDERSVERGRRIGLGVTCNTGKKNSCMSDIPDC